MDNRVAFALGLIALLVLLYRLTLPRYLPKIPHHPETARKPFGDLPNLIKHAKSSGGQILDWMALQCVERDSPIIQLAVKPFNLPFVIVDDHTTSEDILTRRTKEFDRAQETANFFNLLIPDSSIVMKTNERFKSQRRLWSGIMSPSFLNTVAAPHIHAVFSKLVQLWKRKSELSSDHPFYAGDDIKFATLDAIWSITHGFDLGCLQSQLELLLSKDSVALEPDSKLEVKFPLAPLPSLAKSVQDLVNTVSPNTPFPTLRKWFYLCVPGFQSAWNIKERCVEALLKSSRDKFQAGKGDKVASAMDHVIEKEAATEEKLGHAVMSERAMKDETFMILLGGYETTSTTLQWAVKFLADHQDVQTRLHEDMCANFTGANLSAEAFAQQDIPYLDAVAHEVLRVARTTPAVVREAMQDTEILGYPIPKGTTVLMSLQGDSFLYDDSTKKPTMPGHSKYRELEAQWAKKDRQSFDPSRWLKTVDGKVKFDPNAGPSLPFSTGIRGCFGKRLAVLELRIAIALLIRNFHFASIPQSLNSYQAFEVITRMPHQCFVNPISARQVSEEQ